MAGFEFVTKPKYHMVHKYKYRLCTDTNTDTNTGRCLSYWTVEPLRSNALIAKYAPSIYDSFRKFSLQRSPTGVSMLIPTLGVLCNAQLYVLCPVSTAFKSHWHFAQWHTGFVLCEQEMSKQWACMHCPVVLPFGPNFGFNHSPKMRKRPSFAWQLSQTEGGKCFTSTNVVSKGNLVYAEKGATINATRNPQILSTLRYGLVIVSLRIIIVFNIYSIL